MFLLVREADSRYSFSALSLSAPLLLNTHNDIDFGAGLKPANLVKRPEKLAVRAKFKSKKAQIVLFANLWLAPL